MSRARGKISIWVGFMAILGGVEPAVSSHRPLVLPSPSVCDATIGSEGTGDHSVGRIDGISQVMLEGTWKAYKRIRNPASDNPYYIYPSAPDQYILPGANNVFGCPVVGIARGETFTIARPCAVFAERPTWFDLTLIDPVATGEEEPFDWLGQIILFGSSSRMRIEIQVMNGGTWRDVATSDKVKFVEADEYVNGTINPEITEELFAPLGFEFGTPGTYRMTYIWMMINPATWTRFSGPDLIEASRSSLVIVVNPMGEMTVQPKGTGGTTTKSYTFTSDPLAKPALTRLAFLVERKGGSGGHEAAQHLGGAVPKGAWEVMKGTSEAAPVTHPTGRITSALVEARQDSIVKEYESSSFGGDERVSMYLVPPTFPTVTTQKDLRAALDALDAKDKCIADVVEIEVKVPDLIRLRDLPGNGLLDHYTLVGGTDKHVGPPGSTNPDNNHYGEENAIQDLDSVAVTVHQTSWNTSNERPKINDISLPFGGGLDVGGHWGQDLTDPAVGHASHRTGKDFDLNNNSLFDNNETRFRALMCAAGWKFIPVAGAADRHFRYKSCH